MPEQQKSNSEKNEWTVMVYLGGDNNLAEEMVFALKCMHLIGSDKGRYEVVALYDAGFSPVTLEIPTRMRLMPNSAQQRITTF